MHISGPPSSAMPLAADPDLTLAQHAQQQGTGRSADGAVAVPHVIKGRLDTGTALEFKGFTCPRLDMDELVWLRSEEGPAFKTPIGEIIDFLVEVGKALEFDNNPWLQEALDRSLSLNSLERRILETTYRLIPQFFQREKLWFQVEQEIGLDKLDGWAVVSRPESTVSKVRAYPCRLVHILAGNTPAVATTTIVRGALTKGVHLLKLPANDLLTAGAILRTMAAVDADHPTTRSFSAVYWKGGDTKVESAILRPQFFDKLVVWGGEASIRGALRYAGPGFEIVSFDPKVSMSLLGRQAYASEASLAEAVERAATDVSLFNQDACAASRFIYAEGDTEQVDEFCARLANALGKERPLSSAQAQPLPAELRGEIEGLRGLEPYYRIWGDYSGAGLVIRSDEPVDFYPISKTVNVVMVPSLEEAVKHANVATQTVGIFPGERATALRDHLASMGVQRIVKLGEVARAIEGLPHDGFYPLRRFMRWLVDEAG